jgi:hypothetical protein
MSLYRLAYYSMILGGWSALIAWAAAELVSSAHRSEAVRKASLLGGPLTFFRGAMTQLVALLSAASSEFSRHTGCSSKSRALPGHAINGHIYGDVDRSHPENPSNT